MSVDKETFVTNYQKEYKWPTTVPLVAKPSAPALATKPNNFYVATLVEPYCHCDYHLYEPQMGRYKMLAEKEKLLQEELHCLNNQMAFLAGEILNHPCDTYDDKMMTIYQTDYNKKGLKPQQYRQLIPQIDSPIGQPFGAPIISLRCGYRDPTAFRVSAIVRPKIDVCGPIHFHTTPHAVSKWFSPLTGRSEYQDTISNMGMSIIKSSQQYAEPLPSSRRRYGDMCM